MTTQADKTETGNVSPVLLLPKASRAFLVGSTGTGKSTLMEVMISEYMRQYKKCRCLIIDTKPRFKAERELSGISTDTSRRYAKWGMGSLPVSQSYVLPNIGTIKHELNRVWALGGRVAIVSTEKESEWSYASAVASTYYEGYGAHIPRLLVVDELADFYKYRSLADIFQRIARNGRERNCALIAGSQRPRKIPIEIITELLRLYLFHLDFKDDIKRIREFGIPENIVPPDSNGHAFYMFDKKLRDTFPSNAYHELRLK